MSEHFLQSFFSLLSMSMPPLLPFPLLEESSPYQIQYNKNYQLLRNKYKSKVLPLISFCEVSRVSMILQSYFGKPQDYKEEQTTPEKIYCFLVSLAFYEVDNQKFRDFFTPEEWKKFSESSRYLSESEVLFFKEELFRKNAVNYQWTAEEDLLLKTLIEKHKTNPKFKPSWLKISNEFNQFPFISQIRTPAHCQERWKNTLRTSYHRGNWNATDDEKIIGFVMKFGTKWSKLARMFAGRTEHNIKNRFFSILSRELEKPIREIKRNINYRSQKLLDQTQSSLNSENWEIEDFHIPSLKDNPEINEFKIFSREEPSKLFSSMDGLSKKNAQSEFKLSSKEESNKDFATESISNFEPRKDQIIRRTLNNVTASDLKLPNSIILSPTISTPQYTRNRMFFPQKSILEKNSGKKNVEPFDKVENESKFVRTMLTFYLSMKFIRNLKENIGYRKSNILRLFHLKIINDFVYFMIGKQNSSKFTENRFKLMRRIFHLFLKIRCLMRIHHMLKSKAFKFIILPTDRMKLLWDILIALLTISYLIIIPFKIGFYKNEILTPLTDNTNLAALVMFLFDIVINFNTAFYSKGELIVSRNRIFTNYFYGQFLKDILSLTFFISLSENFNFFLSFQLTSVLYLLRIQNLAKIISRLEEFIFTDENTANIISFIRLIFNIYLFAHWSACIWKLIGEYEGEGGWISYYSSDNDSDFHTYINSLYYVIVVINTVGFGDIVARTLTEKAFMICFINIACVLFAYNINSIGMILQNLNKGEKEFKRIIQSINGYMKMNSIDFSLKIKIRNYLEYIWQVEKSQNSSETQEIINRLSKSLKEELLMNANGYLLADLPILNNHFSEQTIRKMVCITKEINFTPGDIIIRENSLNDENLYIVKDGKVEIFMENSQGKDISLNTLKHGDHFGEISFFTGCPRKFSAKSLTFSSLFVLKKDLFLSIIKENNEDYEKFCTIRDKISLYKDYTGIYTCKSCKKNNHTILECPILHLNLSHERVLEKYNFNIPQYRAEFMRRDRRLLKYKRNYSMIGASANELTKQLFKIMELEKDTISLNEESEYEKYCEKSEKERNTSENMKKLEEMKESTCPMDDEPKFFYDGISPNKEREDELVSHLKISPVLKTKTFMDIPPQELLTSQTKKENKEFQENLNKKNFIESLDIDVGKSYENYFPNNNIENLISLMNRIASKNQRKLKNLLIFQSYLISPRKKSARRGAKIIQKSSVEKTTKLRINWKNKSHKKKSTDSEYTISMKENLNKVPKKKIRKLTKFRFFSHICETVGNLVAKMRSWCFKLPKN